MHGILWQDWVTVRGSVAGLAIIQGEADYLDMTPFQDIIVWTDVRETTPPATSLTMQFETAPSKDDTSFIAMATGFTPTAAAAPRTDKILMASAAVPVAHWIRWRLIPVGAGTWSCTFRIWVAANSPGR